MSSSHSPQAKEKSKLSQAPSIQSKQPLGKELLLKIHDRMLLSRLLEERLIRMYKQSDGFFWIGGPGEEAFNVPLGLLGKIGQGLDYDFWHLHYRSGAILVAMGIDPMDAMRQMKSTKSDPFSGGRNFGNHYSKRAWNVLPISSTIGTQYATAIGSGIAQQKHSGTGITIVNGGDAGTAEGEFESSLIWASRPRCELPMLIIVTNNEWGISTPSAGQHGEKNIVDRARTYGIKTQLINGNDVEESYRCLKEAMDYIRSKRKPYFIEARVSRLYGHSSATGCNFVNTELDGLALFEARLEKEGLMSRKSMDELRARYTTQLLEQSQQVKNEASPDAASIYDHVYHQQKGRYW